MQQYDVVVLGGGAAGIFAAITAAKRGLSVCVLEKRASLLAKVKVSGGGRCNVTHACFELKQFVQNYPRGHHELLGPLHHFGPEQILSWFAERGVFLKAEEDGRMFPITDQSQTIIDCFLKEAAAYGVVIHTKVTVTNITPGFCLHTEQGVFKASSVLLATGSSPEGYVWAQQLGHQIQEPVPSLFTLNCPSSPLLQLSGISVPRVTISLDQEQQTGPILLTHFGFSGPAALKLSAWAARPLHTKNYRANFYVNWLPHQKIADTFSELLALKQSQPQKQLANVPLGEIPKRLWEVLVGHEQRLHQIPDKSLRQLSEKLHRDPYLMEGKTTHKEEFVTCGGIKREEIDFRTMQSRYLPGLFFAGEILDIDGVTGGFNFQNAWTTAWIAANHFNK